MSPFQFVFMICLILIFTVTVNAAIDDITDFNFVEKVLGSTMTSVLYALAAIGIFAFMADWLFGYGMIYTATCDEDGGLAHSAQKRATRLQHERRLAEDDRRDRDRDSSHKDRKDHHHKDKHHADEGRRSH